MSELEDLVARPDDDCRTQLLLIARGAGAPVNHHTLGDAGRFVERFRHRHAVDQVFEADLAFNLGEDRARVGIPLRDALTALDLLAALNAPAGAGPATWIAAH